ncbi:putative ribonuclease h protein [Nicotiana attenuata]|uniref:Ribonuclease h protein n=1 Tax=Nicotiana attenuata TaxID=49451 RepID=A0A1J6I2P3_NICAT|nr:putative ribonuclease h protein [Nicotiana attenuata]
MFGWQAKTKNKIHAALLQCLPLVICYEIWNSRYASRFENIHMFERFIIQQVSKYMTFLLNIQFPKVTLPHPCHALCTAVETARLVITSQSVRWYKPDDGWVKLNTDGCSKGNPGNSDGGGILRNSQGACIFAFADYYGTCSNNMAEAKAMLQGIKMCIASRYSNVIVEADSQLIVDMINNKMKVPWHIQHIIDQIVLLSSNGNFCFVHIFREGNIAADQLANRGEKGRNRVIFYDKSSLPDYVKEIVKLVQQSTPNFRFRPRKNCCVINDANLR